MKRHSGLVAISQVIATAAMLATTSVHAGKIITESDADGKQNVETLEFNEQGQLRVTSNGLDSIGMIVRDDSVYFFGSQDGKPVVVDMLAVVKKLDAQGKRRPQSQPSVEQITDIKSAGRKLSVAGIEGEVHTVTWTLDGQTRSEEVVLTRDPRLARLIKSLSLDPGLLSDKPRKSVLKEEIIARGYFLLKSERSVVTSVDFSTTPDDRFALKAKPGDDIDTVMSVLFSTAFGAVGEAVGGAMNAVGDAMSEATSSAEPVAESESESESPKPPPPTNQMLYDGLIAISPPGGLQLPPTPDTDYSNWQSVNVGLASMRIPPGWTIHEQLGEGSEDHTMGWASASGDIYIELRQRQNSDSNYLQTAVDHAQSEYRMSPDRLKEGVVIGFQPMVLDGAVGRVEIMNQFGREKNEDGSLTPRTISWRGRWEKGESIHEVQFTARFAQDQHEKFAPLVSSILATIKTSNVELAK